MTWRGSGESNSHLLVGSQARIPIRQTRLWRGHRESNPDLQLGKLPRTPVRHVRKTFRKLIPKRDGDAYRATPGGFVSLPAIDFYSTGYKPAFHPQHAHSAIVLPQRLSALLPARPAVAFRMTPSTELTARA